MGWVGSLAEDQCVYSLCDDLISVPSSSLHLVVPRILVGVQFYAVAWELTILADVRPPHPRFLPMTGAADPTLDLSYVMGQCRLQGVLVPFGCHAHILVLMLPGCKV